MTGSQFDIIMPILQRLEDKMDRLVTRIDSLEKTRDEDIGAARERARLHRSRRTRAQVGALIIGAAGSVFSTCWVVVQLWHFFHLP